MSSGDRMTRVCNCNNCHYASVDFECRRYPPRFRTDFGFRYAGVVQSGYPVGIVEFPRVQADWWCGEWRKIE